MQDSGFDLFLVAPMMLLVGLVSVMGSILIASVYNLLPWQSVPPQAAEVAQNTVSASLTILGMDPSDSFILVLVVAGAVSGLLWAIFELIGSDSEQV